MAPAETVTEAGTVAAEVLELESVTTAPPAGALPVSVSVAVEGVPPITVLGDRPTLEFAAGVTVSVAVFVAPPATPVIVTEVEEPTPSVVTVNVAVVAPAATTTLAGTVAAEVFELERVTASPPVGAAEIRVTVAVDGFPPATLAGARLTEERATGGDGLTVSAAVFVTPE